jgi:hypothetical protein
MNGQNAAAEPVTSQSTSQCDNLEAELETLRSKVTLTVGTWYEDYVFSDVDSVGLQNIYPGAFFLALNDGSYSATVGYVRLTYHW